MTDTLNVYGYNVGFGDGLLLEIPDGGTTRWVLIDVGNALSGAGSDSAPLVAAVQDVQAKTGGHLDLYVMTHEHLDHVQGLLTAQGQGITLQADHVWMTASADPNYYATHPAAHKKLALEAAVRALERLHGSSEVLQGLAGLLAVNSGSTVRCVDYLRTIGGGQPPDYLHRESAIDGKHPFTTTTLRILAPEEDTSDYYGPARACLDASASGPAAGARAQPLPPPGVDAGAFYNLVDQMDNGLAESLFQIDAAANNTSLVVEITWRHRRLLFVGDAEQRSWQTMARLGLLRPVDFLKVGHHGSRNATPPPNILEQCLPLARRDQAQALVSTCLDNYPGVPDPTTLDEIRRRVQVLHSTLDVPAGELYKRVEIPAGD
jgi:beta-lactamase superfamily II metal-dependent hydrolase